MASLTGPNARLAQRQAAQAAGAAAAAAAAPKASAAAPSKARQHNPGGSGPGRSGDDEYEEDHEVLDEELLPLVEAVTDTDEFGRTLLREADDYLVLMYPDGYTDSNEALYHAQQYISSKCSVAILRSVPQLQTGNKNVANALSSMTRNSTTLAKLDKAGMSHLHLLTNIAWVSPLVSKYAAEATQVIEAVMTYLVEKKKTEGLTPLKGKYIETTKGKNYLRGEIRRETNRIRLRWIQKIYDSLGTNDVTNEPELNILELTASLMPSGVAAKKANMAIIAQLRFYAVDEDEPKNNARIFGEDEEGVKTVENNDKWMARVDKLRQELIESLKNVHGDNWKGKYTKSLESTLQMDLDDHGGRIEYDMGAGKADPKDDDSRMEELDTVIDEQGEEVAQSKRAAKRQKTKCASAFFPPEQH
ncbi:hypothetical protein JCM10213_004125 [Rhodosporidiobolus nylandii]